MGFTVNSLDNIVCHGFDSLIDVRSPAEYDEDHLPGAISLPVLSNDERARVGTIYTREDAFTAKKIGAALVARNAAAHLDGPLADKGGGWRPLIYCWRGGQRSGSFATILRQVGWRAEVIEGGYQTYRRLVSDAMYNAPLAPSLIVLDGNTGTAKTELLHLLRGRGQQVLDLEHLAAHRGSVFGATARAQPSQKAFEGALAGELAKFDPARPVLVEAESSKIGRLLIPPSLWKAMKQAPRLSVSASLGARAGYLNRTYADMLQDRGALRDRLSGLIAHQSRENVEHWQGMAESGDMVGLARALMQSHYDPGYARSRSRRQARSLGNVHLPGLCDTDLARGVDQLLKLLDKTLNT